MKARERQEATLKQNADRETFHARTEQGRASDIVAAEVGFGSGKTYEKAKFVADHAEPEVIAKLDAEETVTQGFAERAIRAVNNERSFGNVCGSCRH